MQETSEARRAILRQSMELQQERQERAAARIEKLEQQLEEAEIECDEWSKAARQERVWIRKLLEATQAQSETVQRDWLSPAEAEGLRQQLWNTEEMLAIATSALDWHAIEDPTGRAVDALAEIERRLSPEALKHIAAIEQQLHETQAAARAVLAEASIG